MTTHEREARRLHAAPNLGEIVIGAAAVIALAAQGTFTDLGWAVWSPLVSMAGAGAGVVALALLSGSAGRTGEDRDTGTYIIGVPGVGKTTYATTLFLSDARRGGAAWITTHGASDVARQVAEDRLVLFSPPATPGLNIISGDSYLAANRVTTLFRRMHTDAGARMDHLLYTAVLTVAQRPEADLWQVLRFVDDAYARASSGMGEVAEMAWADASRSSVQSLRDRLGRMLVSPRLRRGLSDRDGIDLDAVVREGRVLVVDVSQDDSADAAILCEAVLDMLQQVSLHRPPGSRRYPVYADEFQGYADASIETWIAEGRKRRMPLTLIHQGRDQLPARLREATLLCGTLCAFRLSHRDAREMAPSLGCEAEAITDLPTRAYLTAELAHGRIVRAKRRVPYVRQGRGASL